MCVCVCVCALEILVLCALLHMKFDKSTNISTLVNNINVSCANVQTSAICSLNVIIQCCYITPLLHQTNSIPTASYVVLVMCYVYFLMSVFVCVCLYVNLGNLRQPILIIRIIGVLWPHIALTNNYRILYTYIYGIW